MLYCFDIKIPKAGLKKETKIKSCFCTLLFRRALDFTFIGSGPMTFFLSLDFT